MVSSADILNSPLLSRHGLVLVNKPVGVTSHDMVRQARKLFQTRKIGHSGTLDPFSQGLLLLLVGEAVSLQQYFTVRPKLYRAVFRLGMTTDTLDPTGQVVKDDTAFVMPSRQAIQERITSEFLGEIRQVPPAFSAVKVGGRRAYSLAREGKEVSLPERKVRISQFEILSLVGKELEVKIACSSGTYIRTLADDLARSLGTVGMVESLIREKIGDYSLKDALDLGAWGNETEGKMQEISFETLHRDFPGFIPMNILIDREKFLKGVRIECSWEEFFKARNGNFSLSLLRWQEGIFHLTHRNRVLMIVEKSSGKFRVLFNLLKYLDW